MRDRPARSAPRGTITLAVVMAALPVLVAARAAAADEAPPGRPDAVPAVHPDTAPLVLLVQGDDVLASNPGAPDDPPPGQELRLRRVRAGEDVRLGAFRVRALLEGQSKNAGGQNFTPMEGGRLGGAMRVTDAFVSFAPFAILRASVGSMRVPFSLSRQVDAADLRLPERAPIIDAVAPDYRVGAALAGDAGALAYAAAFMASDPSLDHLFREGAFVAARLVAEPIGPVGVTPWRRPAADPWDDWFRFSVGLSFLYGTLTDPHTTNAGGDVQAQWRSFVATGEYVYSHTTAATEQGAVVEPGLAFCHRRLALVARADWRRAADVNQWGGGGALTAYFSDPRLRAQLGFERRTAGGVPSDWVIARLTIAVE
jgi:hypothetical protein